MQRKFHARTHFALDGVDQGGRRARTLEADLLGAARRHDYFHVLLLVVVVASGLSRGR